MEQQKSAVAIGFKDDLHEKINELKTDDTRETYVFDLVDGFYDYIWDEREIKLFLYNPLCEIPIDIKRETRETRAIQKLAYALCGVADKENTASAEEARLAATLLTGAMIHECFVAKIHKKVPSLRNVRNSLASHDIVRTLNEWLCTGHVKRKTHETVEAIAKEMLQLAYVHNTEGISLLTQIRCAAVTPLYIWLDNEINFSTTTRTATLGERLSEEKPISLFVLLPYGSYGFYAPLVRAFFVQFIDAQRQYSSYDTDFICETGVFCQIERMAQGLDFRDSATESKYKICEFVSRAD